MLQNIIITILIINAISSFCEGHPPSLYNETNLEYSINSQISQLREEQEKQGTFIDGKSFDGLVNKSDFQSLKKEFERQKTDGVGYYIDIGALAAGLEIQKKAELEKELNIESLQADNLVFKAELEQIKKLIGGHEKSLNGFVNKSDLQSVKEDGIVRATDIKSIKLELQEFGKIINIIVKKLYPSCTEAKASGVFEMRLFNFEPFKVFCDVETRDGGWTTILRRIDGSVDFYRNWTEYKNGFGNLDGEFFLGLDKIHAITSVKSHELFIVLEDYEGDERFMSYDEFAIGNENEQYVLHTLGKANGTAGDSLSHHRGMKFSTYDRDNDNDLERNCAQEFTGAWWYSNCHHSNLMGKYQDYSYGKGIIWTDFRGREYSLKTAVMMIRPRD